MINTKEKFFEQARLEWFDTSISHISNKKFNPKLSLIDNGIADDLDCMEFIIEIENTYNVSIDDDISDYILTDFQNIMERLISDNREEKLNKIL